MKKKSYTINIIWSISVIILAIVSLIIQIIDQKASLPVVRNHILLIVSFGLALTYFLVKTRKQKQEEELFDSMEEEEEEVDE